MEYKVDFDRLEWQSILPGVRHKSIEQQNIRMRLVEYSQEMPPHWCERGHCGYLLEGRLEIEYDKTRILYDSGAGIFIPDGAAHRHRGKVLSEKVLVFFVEKI